MIFIPWINIFASSILWAWASLWRTAERGTLIRAALLFRTIRVIIELTHSVREASANLLSICVLIIFPNNEVRPSPLIAVTGFGSSHVTRVWRCTIKKHPCPTTEEKERIIESWKRRSSSADRRVYIYIFICILVRCSIIRKYHHGKSDSGKITGITKSR